MLILKREVKSDVKFKGKQTNKDARSVKSLKVHFVQGQVDPQTPPVH